MKKLFSSSQIREADNYAINSLEVPGVILMENAARNIFEIVEDLLAQAGGADITSIGILCGKGNNGGDGYALARHLVNAGYPVDIIALAGNDELKGDALTNYTICNKYYKTYGNPVLTKYEDIDSLESIRHSNVIIDAMLGTGAKGKLREPYKGIIEFVNDLPALKIAIDIPSGLDSDTGYGESVFQADVTITLAGLKKGLFFGDGNRYSGEVYLGGIGIGEQYFNSLDADTFLIEEEDASRFLPQKESGIHKYSAGKILVLAGSARLPGAALFSTKAAFVSGAGAVVLAYPEKIREVAFNYLHGPTVFTYGAKSDEFFTKNVLAELEEKIEWCDVLALGPGLGREEETISGVRKLVKKYPEKKMVIDADAIYALKNNEWKKYNLDGKIFTPHFKEFADLMGIELKELNRDLLLYGREFAKESGALLVLKGAPTIIFDVDGTAYINSTGNRGMAKFGTGDVLTGIIGSFAAQSDELTESTIAAVYLHSLAADLAIEDHTIYSLTPEILMDYFPSAIKKVIDEII